jgi:hypothetical protein
VKFSATLEEAEFLAHFANIKPEELNDFRKAAPDFFPETFWPDGRAALVAGMSDSTASVFKNNGLAGFDRQVYQTLLCRAWAEGFPLPLTIELVQSSGMSASTESGLALAELGIGKAYPYQRAVMFLHTEPWRAKICEQCKNYYVANHSKRRYCSVFRTLPDGRRMNCSHIKINQSKSENWHRKGKQQRLSKRGKALRDAV